MNGLEKLSEPELRMTMAYRMLRELALRYIILTLFATLGFQGAQAQTTDQNYPVTAQAFIAAQPNARLSTYFSSNTALMVNLLLKDLTKSSIQVYLKWSLDGPGVRVASPDGYIPAGLITLDRGVIMRLSGAQLQNDYFLAGAIEEQGLNGNPLRTSLPEGFYTFRVQALEAGTGRMVSNIGETYFSITTPLPPIINIPFNGAELTMTQPQTVNIQWMPRHYRLPGHITSYDLKVCKVPDGYEPTEAMDACVNPVIDDKGNPGTFYPGNTGIGNSIIGAFERGARYAARVTVHEFDINGNQVAFANEGRSEVTWFHYGKPCTSPDAFTINESGPGRVQLSWAAQTGVDGYNVLFRKEGELKWASQKVTAASATVAGLDQGKYEFGIQSVSLSGGCPVGDPENVQPYTLTSDDQNGESLPIALTDPMNLLVQASGCTAVTPGGLPDYYSNFPGAAAPDTAGKLKIPGCALQGGIFSVCSPEHPSVTLPSGTQLTSLAAGDVLGIYDFAVFVTESSGSGTFSGRGLVRLPFLEGTLALAEFSGLKAIQSTDGQGGCVYEVADFRLLSVSQAEVAAAKARLTTALARRTDPAAYAGTLADALARYDAAADLPSACTYQAAVLQASAQIRQALQDQLAGNPTPAVSDLLARLDALTSSLQTGSKVDSLIRKYQDLFDQFDSLKEDSQSLPGGGTAPLYAIRNVRVDNITYQGAAISWEGPAGIDKYIVEYIDKDGAVLQETVQSTLLNLARLREGMRYNYKITAYKDGQVVASYGQDMFSTIKRILPNPENLRYAAQPLDNKAVNITWNANPRHKSYRLIYVDQDGIERIVYPTSNQTGLTGLARDRSYSYRVMAYGEDGLVSEEIPGTFKLGTVCDVRINASSLHVVAGTKVSLNMASCVNEAGQQGLVMWEDGQTQFRQSTIEVTPQVTTTYKVYCQLERILDNGDRESVSCLDSVTVQVENRCEGVLATASATSITAGQPLLLTSTGCQGNIQWKDGLVQSNLLGSSSNIVIYPTQDKTYAVSCVDANGNSCVAQTEKVQVQCALKLAVSNNSYYSPLALGIYNYTSKKVTIKAVGCPGQVTWQKTGGNKSIDESFPDESTVEYVSIKEEFTVTATCVATGCSVSTGSIQVPPTSNFCEKPDDFKIELTGQSQSTLTLKVKSSHPFRWDDNGSTDAVRTFPLPGGTAVFSATMTEKNCKAAYPYQSAEQLPLQIPCNEFVLSKSGSAKIPYNASSTKITFTANGCEDGAQQYSVTWTRKESDSNTETTLDGNGGTQQLTFTSSDVGKTFIVSATCSLTGVKKTVNVTISKEADPAQPIERLQNPCNFYVYTKFSAAYNTFRSSEPIEIKVFGQDLNILASIEGDVNNVTQKSAAVVKVDKDNFIISVERQFGMDPNGNGTNYGSFYVVVNNTVNGGCQSRILINLKPDRTNDPYYDPATIDFSNKPERENCSKYALGGKEIPIIKGTDEKGSVQVLAYQNSGLLFGAISIYNDYIGKIYEPGIFPERLGLVDKVCHTNGGRSEWFFAKSGSSLLQPMGMEEHSGRWCGIEPNPDPKNIRTYYSRCTFADNTYCINEVRVNPFAPSGGRLASETETEPAPTATCVYSTQKAVQALLTDLLCEKLGLIPGKEDAKLQTVHDAMSAQGVELAPVTEQMKADLAAGKCDQVIAALTATITGTQPVETLNAGPLNQENVEKLLSSVVDELNDGEIIDSDFITRQIETFDGPVDVPNLRTAAIGVCPDYYFTPAGKRIRISDIGDCVVSINGVLMSFTKNDKTYIPLFRRNTLAFVGYHDKEQFYARAKPAAGANIRVAQEKDLNLWVTDVEYPAENSQIGRFIDFIDENRAKPGVIANYTLANFNEVKRLLALLPETIFEKIEWSNSVYRFDLLKLKAQLQQMLTSTDTQLAMLNSILTAPETVCKDQTEVICKVFNCVYNNITGYQDRDILNGRLPLETRKKLLTLLAQNTLTSGNAPGGCAFSSDGEGTVISLLKTTPETDRKPVLDYLVSFPVNTLEETPLKRFISKIDGGNFDDLLLIVSDWVSSYYPSSESWQAILQRQDRSKRDLLLLGKNALQTTQSTHSKDGKTAFDFSIQFTASLPILKPNINALDYVVVKFAKDFTVGSKTFYAGEIAKIPAVLCYLIMNDLRNNALATAGKYTAYTVGAAVGVSEIMAATTAFEMTLAIIDMSVLGSDLAMNEVLATKLNQTQEGRTWLDNFNKFTLYYGSARAVVELAGLAKGMRTSALTIDDAQVVDLTTAATGISLRASGLLDDVFLEGWNVDRVLAYPKGQRPPIETYMRPSHISNQLDKFKSEGGAFVLRRRDIEESNYITLAPRKFVGLTSEMKVVMDKYYQAGADTKVLIEELDLGDGYFKVTDEVYLVNIEPNGKFEFDLPNGNEGGAYDGFWVPGGFTGHGTSEAVLSNSGNFPHNNDWQTFVSLFGEKNVKQIK